VTGPIDAIARENSSQRSERDNHGRALNPFPQVPDLDSDASTFLIHAKRVIYDICRLPSMFLPVPAKDTNFDDLGKTLERAVGAGAPVTGFVRSSAPVVRYLIELRNWQEHPGAKRTVVENFAVTPDDKISPPTWYVSGETPSSVGTDMRAATQVLVEIAEGILIHLVTHTIDKPFPFITGIGSEPTTSGL
jgi:hypothetical protein